MPYPICGLTVHFYQYSGFIKVKPPIIFLFMIIVLFLIMVVQGSDTYSLDIIATRYSHDYPFYPLPFHLLPMAPST